MKRMSIIYIFAINIKYYRFQLGLDQTEFAILVGSTRRYINEVENEKRNPSIKFVDKVAEKINVSVADLLTYNKDHIVTAKRIDEKKKVDN